MSELRANVVQSVLVSNKGTTPKGFIIGEKVLIRTLTYFSTGRVVGETGNFVILEDAAFVADTGNLTAAINEGTLSEFCSFNGPLRVNMNNIVDVFHWGHDLPR